MLKFLKEMFGSAPEPPREEELVTFELRDQLYGQVMTCLKGLSSANHNWTSQDSLIDYVIFNLYPEFKKGDPIKLRSIIKEMATAFVFENQAKQQLEAKRKQAYQAIDSYLGETKKGRKKNV